MRAYEVARLFLFVRESGENRGRQVEAIQHWAGGQKGDSWCAEFVSMVAEIAAAGAPRLPRTALSEDFHQWGFDNSAVRTTPEVGALYLRLNNAGRAHHVGFVTELHEDGFTGISGNTSADGTNSNGDRVAEQRLRSNPNTVFVVFEEAA